MRGAANQVPAYRIKHREIESPAELQSLIKCFWYTSIDFSKDQSCFEVMPDGYAEIIFYFGSACSIKREGQLQLLPSPFIMGLLNQPVILHADSRIEVVGIRCFPWTLSNVLGLPAVLNGPRVFQHPIAQLQQALSECVRVARVNDALALLKEYFLHGRSSIATDNILLKAGRAMRNAGGTLPVSDIAGQAHATVRTLQRKFKQSSGHTVKDVTALMRFEQVRNRLWFYPKSNLAALAHELGYTDQSHLSKEFKRYSGSTPAAFARKAKDRQFLSDNDFVAFIQA